MVSIHDSTIARNKGRQLLTEQVPAERDRLLTGLILLAVLGVGVLAVVVVILRRRRLSTPAGG
jgi:hypothetical protein